MPFERKSKGNFVFTGIELSQKGDKGIVMSQCKYVTEINPIHIDANRRTDINQKVSDAEKHALRGPIGSLQYAAVNTRPDLSSQLSFLQSSISQATIETLIQANKILHDAKKHHEVSITIHPISVNDVRFLAFSDASFASKKVPDSHAGSIILTTHKNIVRNITCPVSPISWGCKKIQKVVTSTLSAETMALTSSLDQLSWLRLFWAWLLDTNTVWQDPSRSLQKLPSAIASPTWKAQHLPEAISATDCKSLFDLVTKTAPPQCSEFRTQLHAGAIKDMLSENTTLRWFILVPNWLMLWQRLWKPLSWEVLWSMVDIDSMMKCRSWNRDPQIEIVWSGFAAHVAKSAVWFTTHCRCEASFSPTNKFYLLEVRMFGCNLPSVASSSQAWHRVCFRVNIKAQITLRTVCGGRVWHFTAFSHSTWWQSRALTVIRGRIINLGGFGATFARSCTPWHPGARTA